MSTDFETLTRTQKALTGLIGVVFVVFFVALVGEFLGADSLTPVTDVTSGVLYVLLGLWLVVVRGDVDVWWAVLGGAGFVVGGITQLILLVESSDTILYVNGVALLVGFAAFVYGVFIVPRT